MNDTEYRFKVEIVHLAFSWHPVPPCEASALQNHLWLKNNLSELAFVLKNHMYLKNNYLDLCREEPHVFEEQFIGLMTCLEEPHEFEELLNFGLSCRGPPPAGLG